MSDLKRGGLTKEEVVKYHEEGYLGPYRVLSEDEISEYETNIVEKVLSTDGPRGNPYMYRHLDSRTIYELFARSEITDRVSSLIGDDLLLWATTIFDKVPGESSFAWHQDNEYFDLEPPLNITAWVAVTDSSVDNGCMQIIPGSHKQFIPHVRDEERDVFEEKAHPSFVNEEEAVDIELEPGEFILFNERTLHRSLPNDSDRRRTGVSARITAPFVHVNTNDPKILINGDDQFELNETTSPPTS